MAGDSCTASAVGTGGKDDGSFSPAWRTEGASEGGRLTALERLHPVTVWPTLARRLRTPVPPSLHLCLLLPPLFFRFSLCSCVPFFAAALSGVSGVCTGAARALVSALVVAIPPLPLSVAPTPAAAAVSADLSRPHESSLVASLRRVRSLSRHGPSAGTARAQPPSDPRACSLAPQDGQRHPRGPLLTRRPLP